MLLYVETLASCRFIQVCITFLWTPGVKAFMSGRSKRSHALKQTCSFQLLVCLSTYVFLLPLGIKSIIWTCICQATPFPAHLFVIRGSQKETKPFQNYTGDKILLQQMTLIFSQIFHIILMTISPCSHPENCCRN